MAMSDQRKEYLYKYQKDKLKRIPLDVPIPDYERIKAHAEGRKESVNGFIKRAISETIDRDKTPSQAPEPPQSKGASLPFDGLKTVPTAFSGVTGATDAIPEASRKSCRSRSYE